MELVVQTARLPNGVRLPYVERGSPSGAPLVLLHGYSDSWRSFEGVLERLPSWLRVIAPTQRGHAGADAPMTGYRPADFADDLRQFLDALGIQRAVIAGHSFGSAIAQRFAIDHPDRTSALVLLGSYTTLAGSTEMQECWDTAVAGMTDPVDPAFVRAFQESTIARDVPKPFLEMVIAESLQVPAHVWRAILREGILDCDVSADLRRITAPTLIIWGDRDLYMPRDQQVTLAAEIAGARLVIHAQAGHAIHWEDPARTVSEIASFVAETMSIRTSRPARPVARRRRTASVASAG